MRTLSLSLIGVAILSAQADRWLSPQAKVPDFALPDQAGKTRTFADIRGPKGAMLVFYRSADW